MCVVSIVLAPGRGVGAPRRVRRWRRHRRGCLRNTAYGVSVWAWFVLECYAYHRPLRAVTRALATMGIPIAPGTLADAQSRLLRVFEPC